MPRRKYAEHTSVPIGRSQEDLRQLVMGRGATGWALGEDEGRAVVQFRLAGRVLRFKLSMLRKLTDFEVKRGQKPSRVDAREERRLWRSLVMAVKAKLVIAEDGIETFDEVFLANIVTPDGDTIGERVTAQIPSMLSDGRPIALLSDGVIS